MMRRFPLGGLPAMAPDGHTVALGQNSPSAGDQSSAITLLDLRTGRHRTLLATLPDYWIRSLAFTPDGTKLAGAATDGMHVWDLATGKIVESYAARGRARARWRRLTRAGTPSSPASRTAASPPIDLAGARRLGRAFSWNVPDQGCGYTPVHGDQSAIRR